MASKLALVATAALLTMASFVMAQAPAANGSVLEPDPRGPSPDGNYWFEVEVTIFSSLYGNAPYSEIPVARSNALRYLPQLRLLQNPADSYQFPFPPPAAPAADISPPAPGFAIEASAPVPLPGVTEGPLFSPALPGAFKILDYARDPFIALDRRFWRFNQMNSRLGSTGEHTVLWHQVWRQPLLPRAQTPAIQVIGGMEYGDHSALEGSFRLSGQATKAEVDANLWLSSFANTPPATDEWKLPPRPNLTENSESQVAIEAGTPDIALVPAEQWFPTSIWHLNESRDVGTNALYYLDHPAIGVLVELRPYRVPESVVPATSLTPGFE
jgi:hypothetical protein